MRFDLRKGLYFGLGFATGVTVSAKVVYDFVTTDFFKNVVAKAIAEKAVDEVFKESNGRRSRPYASYADYNKERRSA